MDVDANLTAVERFTREAADAGADIVALPENAAFLHTDPNAPAPIEPRDGPIVTRLRKLAEETGVWMIAASGPEASDEPPRYYNTSLVIDGTTAGAPITAAYRKLHLFDIDIPDGESQKESDSIIPGEAPVVTDVAGVPTGLSICYDLRFPTLYQSLVRAGARIITVSAAFTEFTGKEHWLVLLRARAIETQTYVLAPNQYGFHGGKRRSYGKSVIIDPWGIPVAMAPDRPGWVMARMDLAYQDTVRASLPCLQHRNPAAEEIPA